MRTDTILAVHYQPNGSEPLVERNGRILYDAAGLHGELLMTIAVHALPDAASAEIGYFATTAMSAARTIRPAH